MHLVEEIVLRPFVARSLAFVVWVMSALFLGLVGSVIASGRPSPWAMSGTALVGAGFGLVSARHVLFSAQIEGVEMRNLVRSFSFPWSDVEHVGVRYAGLGITPLRSHGEKPPFLASGRTPAGLGFRLRGGVEIPAAWGTLYPSAAQREQLLRVLRARLEPFGVPVLLEGVDLEQ
jgi:hypothetical protein